MSWARFDDKRALNAKLTLAGFEARGLDEAAICFCSMQETDGYLSAANMVTLASAHGCKRWRRIVDRLVEVGRWVPDGDGWQIHDYLDYNPSRAENEDTRTARAVAGRMGGVRSGERRRSKREANSFEADEEHTKRLLQANGKHLLEPRPVPSRPDPSRPKDPSPGLGFTHDGYGSNDDGDSDSKNGTKPKTAGQLLARLVEVCTGRDRTRVNVEAVEVLLWARQHVSDQLVDEAIGYLSTSKTRPVLPRSVAKLIALRAADAGIVVAPFAPAVKTTKAGSD